MSISVIIPVYNRQQELDELLASLSAAAVTGTKFEVVVVDDGSEPPCRTVAEKYRDGIDVKYYYKENSGPGASRNYGAEKSSGDWLIFLDSDCIIPEGYFEAIEAELSCRSVDLFGGPDRASQSFTPIQKAISYSMTSFLTTGGIRGVAKSLDKFYPRSFNMGVRKDVFDEVGGFSDMRYGEDIDFSYRVIGRGHTSRLFPDAWVYHKRRTDFPQFFRQVYHSGYARILLTKKHKGTLKAVHTIPALFVSGCIAIVVISLFHSEFLLLFCILLLVIFVDATRKTESITIGALSVVSTIIQISGYGIGFLCAVWKELLCKPQKK